MNIGTGLVFGKNYYFLESDQPVAVWAGDTEGGEEVWHMGDDLTMNYGVNAKSFSLHSQTQGAYIFAGSDNTTVQLARDGIAVGVATLNDGDTYRLEREITCGSWSPISPLSSRP